MHKTVLLNELIDGIFTSNDGVYVDCTGGGGGHSALLLSKLSENGRLIVLDRDKDAVARLREKFGSDPRVSVHHQKFSHFDVVLDELELDTVTGLCADFGLSNFQLIDGERGFSFMRSGPLDMRMNEDDTVTAADVVNEYAVETLTNIIRKYGEESFAKKIALAIGTRRAQKKFETTGELAELIKDSIPKKFHKPNTHPATKTFQAIRIYINKELEEIELLLKKIENRITPGGRVGFIAFHSLEDRLVKDALKYYAKDCICPPEFPVCGCEKQQAYKVMTSKPVKPTEKEVDENPLSRSAKMRIAEKV